MVSALASLVTCLILAHFILIFFLYKAIKTINKRLDSISKSNGLLHEKLDNLKLLSFFTSKDSEDSIDGL